MKSKPSYAELEQRVKELENELQTKEQFFNNILNHIPDLVFVKDVKHRWVIFNDAFCSALGRSREELVGKTDYDVHPKEQADVFWEKDNEVLKSRGFNSNEEVYTDASGELRSILTRKAVFTNKSGKKFIVGIAHDITEQKRAEKALADSERRLADIIEFLPDSTWFIDIEGRVVA